MTRGGPPEHELRTTRGLVAGALLSLGAWAAIVVVVLAVAISCADRADPPSGGGGPAGTVSPSTFAERDVIDVALDRAWRAHACATPELPVVEALADEVQAVVETDRASALHVARQYRLERCPR